MTEPAPRLTCTSITRGTPNPSLFGRLKWPSRRIHPTFGPDLVNRETTSQLAAADGALAGINGGYFVLDPKAGSPRRATTRQGRQGCTAGPGRHQPCPGAHPELRRNGGGTADAPTVLGHDYTCTDPDEVIAFTEDFGSATPSGRGLEVVLDNQGTVTAVNAPGARP